MSRMTRLTALTSCVLWLNGCTAYFRDDFEEDARYGPPMESPAGAPEGDQLFNVPGEGSVVVEPGSNSVGNILSMRGPSQRGAGYFTPIVQAQAIGIPEDRHSQIVHADWVGNLSSAAALVEVYLLIFHAGFGNSVCNVTLSENIIYLNGNSIGTYTSGGDHRINLGYYPTSDVCEALKTGSGESSGARTEPATDTVEFPKAQYGLEFQLVEGATPGVSYKIDEVRIWQLGPG